MTAQKEAENTDCGLGHSAKDRGPCSFPWCPGDAGKCWEHGAWRPEAPEPLGTVGVRCGAHMCFHGQTLITCVPGVVSFIVVIVGVLLLRGPPLGTLSPARVPAKEGALCAPRPGQR